MNRLEAERELRWFFEEAIDHYEVKAIDPSAIGSGMAPWQYEDPNLEVLSRARPISAVLKRCPRYHQLILWLRFAKGRSSGSLAWRDGSLDHATPSSVDERLAGLVEHFKPKGCRFQQEAGARAAVRAAVIRWMEEWYAIRAEGSLQRS